LEQFRDEVTADEPGGAGDEYFHVDLLTVSVRSSLETTWDMIQGNQPSAEDTLLSYVMRELTQFDPG
jgi:hypothetical protein